VAVNQKTKELILEIVREKTKWELMNNFFLIIHRKIKTYNNLKKMKNLTVWVETKTAKLLI
jgi:hypothetical protein